MTKPQKALVLGDAGFIGSHLCDALRARTFEVTAPDNFSSGRRENLPDGAKLIEGDIRDLDLVKRGVAGCDVAFHLAAVACVLKCEHEPYAYHTANLAGLISVLQVIRDEAPGAPLIYASSAPIYGETERLPLREDAVKRPQASSWNHGARQPVVVVMKQDAGSSNWMRPGSFGAGCREGLVAPSIAWVFF